jgi:predicted MFS family arabinose efflux permease
MTDSASPAPGDATPAVSPLPILLLVSCTAAWVIAQLSYNALPQLLGPIKETFDRSDEVVTRLYGYELFVFATVALLIAGPLARLSRVFVALVGGAIAVAAGVTSGLTDSYTVLVACRVLVGIGGALVGAAGTAAAASSADPERVFAIITITSSVLLAAEPALLEWQALGPYGLDAGFYAIAGATALLIPLLVWLLPPRRSEHAADSSPWTAILQAPNRALAVAVMLALFIFSTGQGGIWTYIAEIGERSSLEDQAIGNSLSAAQLLGLAGAFLAIWIGDRYGSKWPIVLGIGINVGAAVGLALSGNPIVYVTLTILWYAAYYFVIPYLLGVMAKLDDLGRWAVAVDAMWWLGDAAGPPVAGMIVERSGYELLAAFPLCTGVICISIFMKLLRRFGAEGQASASGRRAGLGSGS